MVLCTSCSTEKPVSDFRPSYLRANARGTCRQCWRDRYRETSRQCNANYRSANPERTRAMRDRENASRRTVEVRRRHQLKVHGLTEDSYATLSNHQQMKCAICERPRSLVVDHCHKTGRVRGLLCDRCNVGIGGLGEDVSTLTRAIEYLQREPVVEAYSTHHLRSQNQKRVARRRQRANATHLTN